MRARGCAEAIPSRARSYASWLIGEKPRNLTVEIEQQPAKKAATKQANQHFKALQNPVGPLPASAGMATASWWVLREGFL